MKGCGLKQGVVFSFAFFMLLVIGAFAQAEPVEGEKSMSVSDGREVSIEYTLKLEDKTVVDSNVGEEPFRFIQGAHQIIPGLEKAIDGMKVGDEKSVTIKPEDAYGAVDETAFLEVDKEQVPADALEVGAQLQGQDQSGRIFNARVAEVKEKTVVLDFNHPLAGKTLHFDVKILDVKESTGFKHP